MIKQETVEQPVSAAPLVIDLDGTLLNSDLLFESMVVMLRRTPWYVFLLPFWLVRYGKAGLKRRLAQDCDLDVTLLPYEPQVIALAREAKVAGRHVVLATASTQKLAEQVAAHLGLFDEVLASGDQHNLSAKHKRAVLVERFGCQGFDYAGNSQDDLVVWAKARHAIVVNPEPGVEGKARAQGNVGNLITTRPGSGIWLKALRMHQWLKNLLIFIPLLAAHQLGSEMLVQGLLAFVLFGLCASSVYLLNDLLDMPDDRRHPSKRHRPFASGRLSLKLGILAIPALLIFAFAGAAILMPWVFTGVLLLYYLITLSYSLWLKRHMAIDVIVLALLYTLRILAGAAAVGLPLTVWMLAFSMFMFLSLALVKRYSELRDARERGISERTPGRGYYPGDLEMVSSLGAASGYLAVMVLALYIHDEATAGLYSNPEWIWLACPLLLFWVTRTWMLTHRGQMPDDPVVFAIKDRVSLLIGALCALIFWIAV